MNHVICKVNAPGFQTACSYDKTRFSANPCARDNYIVILLHYEILRSVDS